MSPEDEFEVSKKNYVLGKTIDVLAGVIIAITFACLWLWFLKRFMLDFYCANY